MASNKGSSRSKSGDEGGFRVGIPPDVRPTIQSIRETTGKQHSDEEIYSVLQDCSMDPNETAQKLLYLDTFHEVKNKRDRKKEGQGARIGRGNCYSNHIPSVAGNGKNAAPRRENGLTERGVVLRRAKNNAVPYGTKASTAASNGTSSLPNGSYSHGYVTEVSVDGVIPESVDNNTIAAKKLEPGPLLPTPTFASMIRPEKEMSIVSSNHLPISASPASVAGVYSSASDPVPVSPVSRNLDGMGTITQEVGSQQKATESNHIRGNKNVSFDVESESLNSEKVASNASDAIHQKKDENKSKALEKIQLSEPLQSSSLSVLENSFAIHSSENDGLSLQESAATPATPEVKTSEVTNSEVKANSQLLPEAVVSDSQHVTFPSHFKVSEAVKNGLTFGSFGARFEIAVKDVNGSSGEINSVCAIQSTSASDQTAEEPSPGSQSVSSSAQGETPDHPESPPPVDGVPPTVSNIPTGTDLKHDELKQEMPLFPDGQQKTSVQSVSNYGFGFMFPSPGSQTIQVEAPEGQARQISLVSNLANGVSVPPSSSPAPTVQSSAAAPPQPVHLFRQPYPSFLSYGHYMSPYFMPQIHQFLSPSGLPQQPSTGNVYLSSAAAAAPGVKFPLSQFKPGSNGVNPSHIGIAAGYGSYGSSPVGFNPITAVTSGNSTSNEDLTASQLKDNHIYTTRPLSEGSGVWIPAPGHDLSNMQINPLYNIALQGQHIAFAPAQTGHTGFPGVYQPAQTLAAPSNTNPLLQQSQAMAAAVETMGPPSGAYQQPQLAQINWNPSF